MSEKVFGPKSKAAAIRALRSGAKMAEVAAGLIESLSFEEDAPGHYSERSVIDKMCEAIGSMISKAGDIVTISCMDDKATVMSILAKAAAAAAAKEAAEEAANQNAA